MPMSPSLLPTVQQHMLPTPQLVFVTPEGDENYITSSHKHTLEDLGQSFPPLKNHGHRGATSPRPHLESPDLLR